ncbi:conserved integral membrane domain protein [Mycobacterium xenopi 4042]|uniref:Conserved integral membrane domain protein n=1 Tax=Mycobacterium xenopi 4042 TaxID=1299334 RepID=X8CMB2_MYCXE|nr:conserved integral membrane domain protein [Mycobacterium xenopi 4042]
MEVGFVVQTRAPVTLWRSARGLPDFWRLLELRVASQFGDGLFQAALAGRCCSTPSGPPILWRSPARSRCCSCRIRCLAVCWCADGPLGPPAGAGRANIGRLGSVAAVGAALAVGANDWTVLCGALIVNGFGRFVSSGLSAALPHVVPATRWSR